MNLQLDKFDRHILEILQEQGDITNRALAEAVGLSPPPCLKRVRRLKKAGVINKTVALLNPDKIGQGLVAFVDVEVESQQFELMQIFEQKILDQPEVLQCYMVSGDSDYLLVINITDMADYYRFVRDVLAKEPNILRYKTRFCMNRTKYSTKLQTANY